MSDERIISPKLLTLMKGFSLLRSSFYSGGLTCLNIADNNGGGAGCDLTASTVWTTNVVPNVFSYFFCLQDQLHMRLFLNCTQIGELAQFIHDPCHAKIGNQCILIYLPFTTVFGQCPW